MIHKIKHKVKQKFPKGGFARNATTLMSGTAIAQGINLAVSPFLTRIYTPEDFGLFAVFLAVVAPLLILATARYESAIMLPEKEEDALSLVALSSFISIIMGVILLVVIFVFDESISNLLGQKDLSKWLYLVPLAVTLTGIYQSLNYLANRHSAYKLLAGNRITQASFVGITSVTLGILKYGVAGLLIASLTGQVFVTILITVRLFSIKKLNFSSVNFKSISRQAKRYVKFPKYDVPSMFINVLANQVPVLMLGKFFSSTITGFYSLTNKIISLPVGLVASAVLDVFRQRASSDYIKNGNCEYIYKKTFKSLFVLSIIPFLIFLFFSPFLFSIIFGEVWRISGEYAQILSVMLFFRFISSPLSYVFFIAEKQEYNLIGQTTLLIFSVISMYIGYRYNDVKLAVYMFSFSYSLVYISYLAVSYRLSRGVSR